MKINIKIKPNSKKGPLVEPQADGSLIVSVREVAVDGKKKLYKGPAGQYWSVDNTEKREWE